MVSKWCHDAIAVLLVLSQDPRKMKARAHIGVSPPPPPPHLVRTDPLVEILMPRALNVTRGDLFATSTPKEYKILV